MKSPKLKSPKSKSLKNLMSDDPNIETLSLITPFLILIRLLSKTLKYNTPIQKAYHKIKLTFSKFFTFSQKSSLHLSSKYLRFHTLLVASKVTAQLNNFSKTQWALSGEIRPFSSTENLWFSLIKGGPELNGIHCPTVVVWSIEAKATTSTQRCEWRCADKCLPYGIILKLHEFLIDWWF